MQDRAYFSPFVPEWACVAKVMLCDFQAMSHLPNVFSLSLSLLSLSRCLSLGPRHLHNEETQLAYVQQPHETAM